MPAINLTDHGLAVLAQPDEAQLQELAAAGVRTVINLRNDGEDMQPMSVQDEGTLCKQLGMDYVNLPVSMKTPEDGGADAKLATAFETVLAVARETGPVAVHCKLGQRAGAMVLIALARHRGWDAERALAEADRLGLAGVHDHPKLTRYVSACLAGPRRDDRPRGS
ncbi:MAG: sulfur transferase domain-containing protein [Planctomycetota bacterium]